MLQKIILLFHSLGETDEKRTDHSKCNVRASKNAEQAYFLGRSSLLTSPPYLSSKTIAFISSGANKQKIKLLAHNQCNVRASKNAEQAFSTQ